MRWPCLSNDCPLTPAGRENKLLCRAISLCADPAKDTDMSLSDVTTRYRWLLVPILFFVSLIPVIFAGSAMPWRLPFLVIIFPVPVLLAWLCRVPLRVGESLHYRIDGMSFVWSRCARGVPIAATGLFAVVFVCTSFGVLLSVISALGGPSGQSHPASIHSQGLYSAVAGLGVAVLFLANMALWALLAWNTLVRYCTGRELGVAAALAFPVFGIVGIVLLLVL
jgi:hypothetical protein